MCGIFALLNNEDIPLDRIKTQFVKGKNRGPENSQIQTYTNMVLGFHRLAINGLNNESNQPLIIGDIILICNGEIYNYKDLYKSMGVTPITDSDCEVIIHLFLKYGIDQTLVMLDGVFAFVLYDTRCNKNGHHQRVYVARDAHGVRPLYFLRNLNSGYVNDNLIGFASELKCLDFFVVYNTHQYKIEQFKPGSYSVFQLSTTIRSSTWAKIVDNQSFYNHIFPITEDTQSIYYKKDLLHHISHHLNNVVKKQCGATDRPIACLLSGGLDSSLISALVNYHCKVNNFAYDLETFSIGLAGSEDLKYAKIAADYLKTKEPASTRRELLCEALRCRYRPSGTGGTKSLS